MQHLLGLEAETAEGDRIFCAAADREVGISLKLVDDPKILVVCLNRTEMLKRCKSPDKLRTYHEVFSAIVADLVAGGVVRWIQISPLRYVGWWYAEPKGYAKPEFLPNSFECAFE